MFHVSHSDLDALRRQGDVARCRHCRGTGTLVVRDGSEVRCHACRGVGWVAPEPEPAALAAD